MKYTLKSLLLIVTAISIWLGTAKYFYLRGSADTFRAYVDGAGAQIIDLYKNQWRLERRLLENDNEVTDVQILQIQVANLQERLNKVESAAPQTKEDKQ